MKFGDLKPGMCLLRPRARETGCKQVWKVLDIQGNEVFYQWLHRAEPGVFSYLDEHSDLSWEAATDAEIAAAIAKRITG